MYREKALTETWHLLAIKVQNDLGHALHLCTLLENQNSRNSQTPKNPYLGRAHMLPQTFHPQLYHYPNQIQLVPITGTTPTQTYQFRSYNQPYTNQASAVAPYNTPKPPPRTQPKSVPMDVDHSANNGYAGKIPLSAASIPNTNQNKMRNIFPSAQLEVPLKSHNMQYLSSPTFQMHP